MGARVFASGTPSEALAGLMQGQTLDGGGSMGQVFSGDSHDDDPHQVEPTSRGDLF